MIGDSLKHHSGLDGIVIDVENGEIKMIFLKIIAKILFLPFGLIALFMASFVFMFSLAWNEKLSFKDCLEFSEADKYWRL